MLSAACHQLIYIKQPRASVRRHDGSAPYAEQKQEGGSQCRIFTVGFNREMNSRRLLSRLASRILLAHVHLSVVELGHFTGRAADGVARLVVIPPL
jgi:hypothetical protein